MKSVMLDANQATPRTVGDIDDELRRDRVLPTWSVRFLASRQIAMHIQPLHNPATKSTFFRLFSRGRTTDQESESGQR